MTAGKTGVLSSLLILFLFVFNSPVVAEELLFFFEYGCPHCGRIEDFLQKRIKPNYPIDIKKYEIHEPENASLLLKLAKAYQAQDILDKGTPAVFVGEEAFQGSSRAVQRKIEEAVRFTIRNHIVFPLSRIREEKTEEKFKSEIALPAVISSALVDSINPCACAVLVLLLGTILLTSGRKRKAVLGAGFAFTSACYISYFLMGFGLFSAVQIAGIQHYIYVSVAILALLIGIWNMKEGLWQGERFRIGVPKSWQPKLKKITSSIISVPGAFGIGLVISLFLLPCTSGPYVVIIGMLSHIATRIQAVMLLILYNFIFILPFIIITLAVGLGLTTTARIEMWRQENMPKFHFITGAVMFALGIGLLVLFLMEKV